MALLVLRLPIEFVGHQRTAGDGELGELRPHRRGDAYVLRQDHAFAPAAGQRRIHALAATGVPHADLPSRKPHTLQAFSKPGASGRWQSRCEPIAQCNNAFTAVRSSTSNAECLLLLLAAAGALLVQTRTIARRMTELFGALALVENVVSASMIRATIEVAVAQPYARRF